jgi:hypothetical protein
MKIRIFIISLIISIPLLSGQSVDALDTKYGFKIFKFGTTPDLSISELIESGFNKNPNVTEYRYTGSDMNTLYNVPVIKVKLTYYKNKLMSIMVDFGTTFSEGNYDLVLYSLQQLFGEGNNCITDDSYFTQATGRKWVGKKVSMEILRMYAPKQSAWCGYLLIVEQSLEKQRISDEF